MKAGATPPLRIVVLGYIIRGPIGGMAWHHLNYVLGLKELGHEVLFLEDSDDHETCYNPEDHSITTDPGVGLAFAEQAFRRLGHGDGWCYFDAHSGQWHGPAAARAVAFCRGADLVLNISGVNPLRDWTRGIPVRVLIDTDPLFTQVRHLQEPGRVAFARAHNRHFTFGENIPAGRSLVPDDGFAWRPTRQPVSLAAWSRMAPARDGAWTTVMQWDSYATRQHGGIDYGMKSRSFTPYMDLPKATGAAMALAIGGEAAPREDLRAQGWQIDDPMAVTRTIDSYRDYILGSRGEWSVAKHGYVAARTGWFSERSACYLASGRPVIVEDTGCDIFPDGVDGVRLFSSPDDARVAVAEIEADYERHCAGARQLAEDLFAPGVVLPPLLEAALASRQIAGAAS